MLGKYNLLTQLRIAPLVQSHAVITCPFHSHSSILIVLVLLLITGTAKVDIPLVKRS